MNGKQIAFTLIELLVVIAIIGILSGLIVVTMNGVTNKANVAKGQVFSNSLRNALMLNMVSEWKFDGSGVADGGTATTAYTQDTWGSNSGTTINSSPVVRSGSSCVSGSCLEFDGVDDYIVVGDKDNLSFTDNIFTFSFWIKPTTAPYLWAAFGKRGGPWEYGAYGSTSSTLYFVTWTSSGASAYNSISLSNQYINGSDWTNYVWTADGTNNYLYKNGLQVASNNRLNSMSNTTSPFEIGRAGDSGGYAYHHGLLDELRVFNVAMPVSQIKEQYYADLNNLLAGGTISKEEYSDRLSKTAIK